jgi:hypothetical protein
MYSYVNQGPTTRIDPFGLDAYRCKKPLDALTDLFGGSGERSGPDVPGNPLYHQYICVKVGDTVVCGGQTLQHPEGETPAPWDQWGPGAPSKDEFVPDRCEKETGDSCMDKCLKRAFAEPRPDYGLVFPGTNCQEWSDDVFDRCKKQCGLKPSDSFFWGL